MSQTNEMKDQDFRSYLKEETEKMQKEAVKLMEENEKDFLLFMWILGSVALVIIVVALIAEVVLYFIQ